ncbi:hypothetical protein BG000_011619 [Podila horticola]|nr:hypothetical protein BG000_011619 [Podila horticola]
MTSTSDPCTYFTCKLDLLSKANPTRDEKAHLSRYHSDEPVAITCKFTGKETIIHRNPAANMFYRCICGKDLMPRSSVKRHFDLCDDAQLYIRAFFSKDDTLSVTRPPSTTTSSQPPKKRKKNQDQSEQSTSSSQQQLPDVSMDQVPTNTTDYAALQHKVEVQEATITDLRRRLERLEKDRKQPPCTNQ